MSVRLQKADFWKRISAYLFDILIIFIISVAAMLVCLSAFKFDSHLTALEEKRAEYELEYGIDLDITKEEFDNLSDADKQAYNEKHADLNAALSKDEDVKNIYGNIITVAISSISLGLLIANLIVYFAIPVLLKNGQTLGKKCFGLAVIRTSSVKISTPVLFARAFVGQYAIETMFPAFLFGATLLGLLGSLGLIVLGLFAALEIGVIIASPTNSAIHDLLSDTVVVDLASQEIFESYDTLVEYEKAEAAKKANEANYV
ncbi:MAG: RDD family protein [Clostridia bacterium]|nr:RDD family protein [Clostridia bacterium]